MQSFHIEKNSFGICWGFNECYPELLMTHPVSHDVHLITTNHHLLRKCVRSNGTFLATYLLFYEETDRKIRFSATPPTKIKRFLIFIGSAVVLLQGDKIPQIPVDIWNLLLRSTKDQIAIGWNPLMRWCWDRSSAIIVGISKLLIWVSRYSVDLLGFDGIVMCWKVHTVLMRPTCMLLFTPERWRFEYERHYDVPA